MSQYKDIPQPADQRNVSQGDILTNYRYLSTPINRAAGVPQGIIPVDHEASGDNVAHPVDGFHKQVSYLKLGAIPTTLVNTVNAQSSNGISYVIDGANSTGGMEHFYNGNRDYPKSITYAIVRFTVGGSPKVCTILGNAFNVTSVAYNSIGNYTITFTKAMPDANYLPIMTAESTASTVPFPLAAYRNAGVSTLKLVVGDASTGTFIDPDSVSVHVIEYF
jgi:hypothetical protein